MTASLPSWSSASLVARSEPSASPSGFSCVVTTKRSWSRIASATAVNSLAVVWGELIDQFRHANPALDRGIVFEGQLGGPLQAQLAREPRLQHRVRSLKPDECLLPFSLRAEHGDEHAGVTQIR